MKIEKVAVLVGLVASILVIIDYFGWKEAFKKKS